jgi:tetratricopeptide (TPR) repeat protein
MKNVLATMIPALLMAGMLHATPIQTATQGSEKVIKDPGEYNEYMAAFNTRDPAKRGEVMERFLQQYPQSVVRTDALEQAMAAFQETSNLPKAEAMATQIVAGNPDHLNALLLLAFAKRDAATNNPDPKQSQAVAAEGRRFAEHALPLLEKAAPPAGVPPEQWNSQRAQLFAIFYGAIAFSARLSKDFGTAHDYYAKALAINPGNLADVYEAGIVEISETPADVTGFWHIAKAASLAEGQKNSAAAKAISNYGRTQYARYHGNYDGWDEFAASVAAQVAPPPVADLKKRISTPCDVAVQAVGDAMKDSTLSDLSFSDYEFVLQKRDCSAENRQAAEVVWKYIQEKQKNGELRLRLKAVKVLSATADMLDASLTDENQSVNKADLHVVFLKPLGRLPAVGSVVDVIGVLADYQPEPFMFTMRQGELPATDEPAAKPKPRPKTNPGASLKVRPAQTA